VRKRKKAERRDAEGAEKKRNRSIEEIALAGWKPALPW